jgi:hypothetical protein
MRMQRYARAAVALIAAYAVALQTILLVLAGPLPGATTFAAVPICSAGGAGAAGSAPGGHAHDCLAACLTGCCCGAAAVPAPASGLVSAPVPVQRLGAASEAASTSWLDLTRAHRSRAPPLA